MRIRIATKGWNGGQASSDGDIVGVEIPWVELDGHRTNSVVSATVEAGAMDTTRVTLTFIAAVEMVLLDPRGEIVAAPTP